MSTAGRRGSQNPKEKIWMTTSRGTFLGRGALLPHPEHFDPLFYSAGTAEPERISGVAPEALQIVAVISLVHVELLGLCLGVHHRRHPGIVQFLLALAIVVEQLGVCAVDFGVRRYHMNCVHRRWAELDFL